MGPAGHGTLALLADATATDTSAALIHPHVVWWAPSCTAAAFSHSTPGLQAEAPLSWSPRQFSSPEGEGQYNGKCEPSIRLSL